jgi:catechol 1,2-dioxygenase
LTGGNLASVQEKHPQTIAADALETATCAVTQPFQDEPPDDPNADPFGFGPWHINAERTLWVGLPPDLSWHPGGEKVIWIRPAGTKLTITGQRLDGEAPPLRADIPCCYPTGFQVTGLFFPTEGCWEVTATAGEHELRFITQVTSAAAPTAVATSCEPTPYYTTVPQPVNYPELPSKLTLPQPDEPGERLIVSGAVYAEDCVTPLAGALIEVWQANAVGEYTYLEGQLRTDAQGRYEIDTIKPEMYGPPPHIHFRVFHPDAQSIETELLFEGDSAIPPGISEVAITGLTLEESAGGPLLRATFDIVLE